MEITHESHSQRTPSDKTTQIKRQRHFQIRWIFLFKTGVKEKGHYGACMTQYIYIQKWSFPSPQMEPVNHTTNNVAVKLVARRPMIIMYITTLLLSVSCYFGINLQIDQFNHRQIGCAMRLKNSDKFRCGSMRGPTQINKKTKIEYNCILCNFNAIVAIAHDLIWWCI